MITPEGEQPAAVGVQDGRIVAVEPLDVALEADRIVALG